MKYLLSLLNPTPLLNTVHNFYANWNNFWFTPADPTVLGFLRICAGVVFTYILIVSTALIPLLYAPQGIVDVDTLNQIRLQSPTMLPPEQWANDLQTTPPPPTVHHPELINAPGNEAYRRTWGIDPPIVYEQGLPLFSHLFHIRDLFWIYTIHYLCIVVAILFTLGLGSRVITTLAWLIALSYMHRSNPAAFGMDTMLGIVMLYLMIGSSTSALSLDYLIARYRKARKGIKEYRYPESLQPIPSVTTNLAYRLFQIQFCIMYWIAGASKLQGAAWWNGTALWQTMSNYEFAPPNFAFNLDLMLWIAQHRMLWELLNAGGAIFTLVLELSLPYLIWYPRWRWTCLIGAVLLHTGIALAMGLTAFSLLMIIIVGAFIPKETLQVFLHRLLFAPQRLWLLYNSRQRVGIATAALVKAVDVYDQITFLDAGQSARSTNEPPGLVMPARLSASQLLTETGQAYSGYPLIEKLCRGLRLLWPFALLGRVPGVGWFGRSISRGEGTPEKRQPVTAGR